jgi:hypothetical protein
MQRRSKRQQSLTLLLPMLKRVKWHHPLLMRNNLPLPYPTFKVQLII